MNAKLIDPRQVFFSFLADQVDELEILARDLAEQFIREREAYRRSAPGRRALGLYVFVARDKRTKRLSIEWRKSRYIDNSPKYRTATNRDFAVTQHVHRCPRDDLAYSARNILSATKGGERWECELVKAYEKRAVVLRRHSAMLAEFQVDVAALSTVDSLRY